MTSKFFRLGSAGSNIFWLRLNWNSARLRLKRFSAELLRLRLWRPGLGLIGIQRRWWRQLRLGEQVGFEIAFEYLQNMTGSNVSRKRSLCSHGFSVAKLPNSQYCILMCRFQLTGCISGSLQSQSVDQWIIMITCRPEVTRRYVATVLMEQCSVIEYLV